MQTGLPADDGAKRVWCQALVDANIFLFVQMADA